jgi:hypothetical protein
MADIKNYTLNFGCGTRCALDLAGAKSAFAELQRSPLALIVVLYG